MDTRGWVVLVICASASRVRSLGQHGCEWAWTGVCAVFSLPCGAPCVSESPQLPPLAFTALSAPFAVDCVPRGCVWSWGFLEVSAALRVGPNPVGSVSSLGDAHTGRGHVRTQPEGASQAVTGILRISRTQTCLGRRPRDSETEMVVAEAEPAGRRGAKRTGGTVLWFSSLGSRSLSCHPTEF